MKNEKWKKKNNKKPRMNFKNNNNNNNHIIKRVWDTRLVEDWTQQPNPNLIQSSRPFPPNITKETSLKGSVLVPSCSSYISLCVLGKKRAIWMQVPFWGLWHIVGLISSLKSLFCLWACHWVGKKEGWVPLMLRTYWSHHPLKSHLIFGHVKFFFFWQIFFVDRNYIYK